MATTLHMPPEMEAHVRALAEDTKRDMQVVIVELIRDGLAAAHKRALEQKLKAAHDEFSAGNFISAEQSLAMLDEE